MEKINQYRKKINQIDKQMVKLLAKRVKIVKKIMQQKRMQKIPLKDNKREQDILKKQKALARKLKINPALVKRMFKGLFRTY